MNGTFSGDTIAAISTPVAAGGIGMVRMSGPQAFEIADQILYPFPIKPFLKQADTMVCLDGCMMNREKLMKRLCSYTAHRAAIQEKMW